MSPRPLRLTTMLTLAGIAAATLAVLWLPDWHRPVASVATAPTMYGQLQFRTVGHAYPVAEAAPALPAPPPDDPRPATLAYRNVQVLTDVSASQFMQTQAALTAWVSPRQGCAFCHVDGDWASDAKPQKAVARIMLRMTRHLNADWSHVAPAGVTCFTCHRGQPVPAELWFPSEPVGDKGIFEKPEAWNQAARTVRQFFPDAGYALYLLQDTPAHGQSYTALPSGETPEAIVVTRLYEVMMQMSDGIGVNCGYCHNSRNFADWNESTPARWTGYSGIQLTRDLNRNFLLAVAATLPQTRTILGAPKPPIVPLAESGTRIGNGLVLCATCHYGHPQPLDGANLLREAPGLGESPGLGKTPGLAVHAARAS